MATVRIAGPEREEKKLAFKIRFVLDYNFFSFVQNIHSVSLLILLYGLLKVTLSEEITCVHKCHATPRKSVQNHVCKSVGFSFGSNSCQM